MNSSCQNFRDEACWFLSLRFFELLSSSLLLFLQRFDISSGLLQVFVELGNLHGTSNYVLYWIHWGHILILSSSNTHSLSIVTSRENTLTLSISTNRVNTLFLFLTFVNRHEMYTLCNHFRPCSTYTVRPTSASKTNTDFSSNHRKKETNNQHGRRHVSSYHT